MASNIMPFNSISVKVVQNSHTGFFFSVLLDLFTVVGLAARRLESAKKRLENEAWHGSHLSGMCPLFIKTFSRTKELTPWVWKSIFKERPLIPLLAHYSANCIKFRFHLHLNHITYPPVKDQSWKAVPLVGFNRAWLADQNHPLTLFGKKSGRSQPSKLHKRPEVQMYLTPRIFYKLSLIFACDIFK